MSFRAMLLVLSTLLISTVSQVSAADAPPFKYVDATAFHILPETHNNQSGYFSLCEGLDGNVFVGTAKYGENAYLVEFDPRTRSQRSVLDVNKICGLTAKDYAAQAKLHTRNFVGPRTGKVYVGSKQGYRLRKDDTSEYPGGYVLAYDPRTGRGENLGMPMATQGVIDVAVDEDRDKLYVVTCEDQHWMLGTSKGGPYKELGPMLTPYASTLISADGVACAVTKDFELAQYDPASGKVTTRPIEVDGLRWARPNQSAIPTWQLSVDRKSAWLILMNDPTLLRIDLSAKGEKVAAKSFGKLIDGKHPDSRCGLDVAPDGKVWAIVRVDNETGFGKGYLHHIIRFDPEVAKTEDLGVLRVSNPDYFDFNAKGPDGKPLPWTHGFHTLPDKSLTPLHAHMALMVAKDNTVYVTVIYPFTLLKIDAFKKEPEKSPARASLDANLRLIDRAEKNLPQITKTAETIAQRHLKGGTFGLPFYDDPLYAELYGRSGNIIHMGFERVWKKDRSPEEQKQDVAFVGRDRPAGPKDDAALQKLKDRGVYIVGFGPASLKFPQADVWIDTSDEAGLPAVFGNAVNGWTLMAELVAALNRQGKMPTMWKSWAWDDGKDWGDRYFHKQQFHDDLPAPKPISAGELGREFLRQIRYPVRQMNVPHLRDAAKNAAEEQKAGRKTIVAWQGHMPMLYVGRYGTESWAKAAELHPFLDSQIASYTKNTPDEALVISLGYHGLDPKEAAVWKSKRQRVIHLTGDHPDPKWNDRAGLVDWMSLGFAFGDACVTLDGYPIRILAPSGIAQLAAFQAIDAEVRTPTP